MSDNNVFTLDGLRSEIEKKYQPTVLDGVTLLNPLLMESEQRRRLQKAIAQLRGPKDEKDESDEDDEVELTDEEEDRLEQEGLDKLRNILRAAARKGDPIEKVIEEIGSNLMLLRTVIETYFRKESVGEASASQE